MKNHHRLSRGHPRDVVRLRRDLGIWLRWLLPSILSLAVVLTVVGAPAWLRYLVYAPGGKSQPALQGQFSTGLDTAKLKPRPEPDRVRSPESAGFRGLMVGG